MYQIKQSEATAARRRIPVLLVDITDGFVPETGVVTPTINVSKNGAAVATGAGTWTEIGNGQYYYEFTAGEVDTLGWIAVNIEKATVSRDFNAVVQVMAYDYAVATNLGLSALPAVASGSAGAIPTTGTGANQIQVNGSGAISTVVSVSGSVGSVAGNVSGSVASVIGNVGGSVGSVVGAVGSVTGNIGGNLTGSVGSLTATAVQNIWDDLTVNNTVVGSVGKLIVDNLNAPVGNNTPTNVWSFATRLLTSGANIVLAKGTGITGFNDISAQNVWDVATSGLTTVGSIGLKLNTNVDTTISSRMATFTYTTPPTAAAVATQVWSEVLPGSYTATMAGFKLNAAGSAADPWSTLLPSTYPAGTAGNIIGNRLDTNVGSRMATFTLPTNFSLLSISGTGGVTAGTVSDKTGYSLSTSQTFNTTGSVGSVVGSVASVSGSIGGNVNGTVASVVGNVGGNVVGSVGSVIGSVGSVSNVSNIWDYLTANITTTNSIGLLLKTNVDAQISTRLPTSSYSAAPTVTQIWQAALPGSFTLGQAGFILGTNLDAIVSSRLASSSYTAPPTTTAIMQALWNQVRATSSPTGGIPAVGTYGYFLDTRVSTGGGGGGGSAVIIKQGPFKLNATQDMGQNDVLDLVQNDARNIVLEVIDENNEPIPLSALYTYTVNIYDIGGTGAGTYAGVVDYANGGQVSFDITTTTTATKGTYYVVLSIDNGTIITKYGGLRLEVR